MEYFNRASLCKTVDVATDQQQLHPLLYSALNCCHMCHLLLPASPVSLLLCSHVLSTVPACVKLLVLLLTNSRHTVTDASLAVSWLAAWPVSQLLCFDFNILNVPACVRLLVLLLTNSRHTVTDASLACQLAGCLACQLAALLCF